MAGSGEDERTATTAASIDGVPGSYPYDGEFRIDAALLDRLVSLCRDGLPDESCGLVGGRAGQGLVLYPLANTAASPERYEIDPLEQLEAYRAMDADGLEAVAIYHSHPHTPARPSATDIAEANDPSAVQLIVSFADDAPSVRAFAIREANVTEMKLATSPLEEADPER